MQYVSSIPLFWFFISNVGGGGEGNVFLAFYAISNISRKKKILGIIFFLENKFFFI